MKNSVTVYDILGRNPYNANSLRGDDFLLLFRAMHKKASPEELGKAIYIDNLPDIIKNFLSENAEIMIHYVIKKFNIKK